MAMEVGEMDDISGSCVSQKDQSQNQEYVEVDSIHQDVSIVSSQVDNWKI